MALIRKSLLVAIALAIATTGVHAQEFPTRPIRIVVPYPAGGPSDLAMRLLAAPMSQNLGQSIVIENRPGGGGRIGTESALQAERDGYTLLVGGTATLVVIPTIQDVRYNPRADLIPLGQIFNAPPMLVVRSSLGLKTMPDVIAYAKANPGKMTIGFGGLGTNAHLAVMLWAREAGVDITPVPYRSTPLWVNDVVGNQIVSGFGEPKTLMPLLESGALTAIATTASKRTPQLPNLPTMAEVGLPAVQTELWFGVFALGKTPAPIIERLKVAVRAAQTDPAYVAIVSSDHSNPGEPGAAAFAKLIEGDIARLTPVIRDIRAQLQ